MIATSHNMVYGASRTIIILKKEYWNKRMRLTHRGLVKMDIVHNISKCISPMRLFYFVSGLTEISKMIPLSTSHLWFKILAWHRIGVMPLYETKMALLTDAYVRHLASVKHCAFRHHYSDITWVSYFVSNHQQVNFLFNSLFRLTKKHQCSTLLTLCWGNPLVISGFSSQKGHKFGMVVHVMTGIIIITFPTAWRR